ncbi:PREDICTED: prune homolog [Prunus dulcis]|uniref:PREDICTED: prune homolog n=1 Tax=Prunus dulcis TaxID=3755 RepID=A0A5E4FFH3_PRUDU|nr:PREDICTED: prune homolog [Prunus dulcis]
MEKRIFSRESRSGPMLTMQHNKQRQPLMLEVQRRNKTQQVADLTDFMNDMFFGTVNAESKSYNLTGDDVDDVKYEDDGDSPRPTSATPTNSKMTQEWLEEARRIVASSPTRCESPSRLAAGSPRFAAPPQAPRLSFSSALDRRDPLSRSARRHRAAESFSGEILSKSANKHTRNKSDVLLLEGPTSPASPVESSPASAVHKWFSNILKPNSNPFLAQQPNPEPMAQTGSARLPVNRRSRFQNDPSSPRPQGIPIPSRRTFQSPTLLPDAKPLSPPKNLVPSAHRRSISSSTCSNGKGVQKPSVIGWPKDEAQVQTQNQDLDLNRFLKEQRTKVEKVLDGQVNAKAKIVLSDPSNSTSTMAAAICYAWLLENRARKENKSKGNGEEEYVVVPVMNVKRGSMWKKREAAWLVHHVGLDATSLLFADEVDLESLMMAGKLNILVIGQDVLTNNGEVGSQCTILTDNYCEDAYDLLENPLLKKLLLAGILLDTQNLKASPQLSMTRDAEAVQLLLVGLPSNYRDSLFDQLTQDQRDNSFLEALRQSYGKPPNESGGGNREHDEQKVSERKSTSISRHEAIIQNPDKNSNDARNAKKASPKSAKPSSAAVQAPSPDASRGKNKFFLAKWFGFK